MYAKSFLSRLLNRAKAEASSRRYWLRQEEYNYAAIFPERHARQIKFTEDNLLPRMKPTDRVVDLGCADGWHSTLIARAAKSLHGYDLNEKFIELARSNASNAGQTNCTFEVADALKLELDHQSTDVVIMSGLTTCFTKDSDALHVMEKASNALVPQGFILFKDTLTRGAVPELNVSDDYGAAYRDKNAYFGMMSRCGLVVLAEAWIDDIPGYGSIMALAQRR